MGGQCSNIQAKTNRDFEFVKQIDHISLGKIRVVRKAGPYLPNGAFDHINLYVGVKEIYFDNSSESDSFVKYLEEIKQFDNIPTLIRILSYQFKSQTQETKTQHLTLQTSNQSDTIKQLFVNLSEQLDNNQHRNRYNCAERQKQKVTLFIEYHDNSLSEVVGKKKRHLRTIKQYYQNKRMKFPFDQQQVKLCDYKIIDTLGHNERKIINLYYQEIEILRMIDHIVGALYFLHHFGYPHQAINPSNILIDADGKYILVDPKIFGLQTNYMRAMKAFEMMNEGKHRVEQGGQFVYLAPELYNHLKMRHKVHNTDCEKSDIFSVGMIGVEMCLLDLQIRQKMINQQNIQIVKSQITKMLLEVRNRYSDQLVDLLKSMLEFNPNKRINYSNLIDKIHPLLTRNLQTIQKLYNDPETKITNGYELNQSCESLNLIQKLNQFDNKYISIMNQTKILNCKYQDVDHKAIIQDQTLILRQLKQLNNRTHHFDPNSHNKILRPIKQQIKGTDLYELYLSEYENIRKHRNIR